ncbi:beta-klotho [Discoglossus pictus]
MWLKGYWMLVAIVLIREVIGTPGEGRKVWERSHLVNYLNDTQLFTYGTFPKNFLWGIGSSSQQVEDHTTRGPSIWDHSMKAHQTWNPNTSLEQTSSLLHREIQAMEFLGVNFYHFSISWPRLFPGGVAETPSEHGVQYYNTLINLLSSKHLQPVITLYHWDLPLSIQERYGGWANQSTSQLFNDYARFCFQEFGDRVKYWITMHNPYLIAYHGYGTGLHAPWQRGDQASVSAVAHNLIKAHAMVWHTYDKQFRQSQNGFLSITLGSHWIEPEKGKYSSLSIDMCQESMETVLGRFAKPIHSDGDYPEILKRRYGSILPNFTETEKSLIKGTADFFAFSFGPEHFGHEINATSLGQSQIYLRGVLNWINLEYDNPRILIVENGWFTYSHIKTEDTTAIYLMKKFINEVLRAIKYDNINVFGYTAWSLMDGFEWQNAYKIRRGLFYNDLHSNTKEIIPKTSASYYKQVIKDNGFPSMDYMSPAHGQFPCDFSWGVTDSDLKAEVIPSSPQFVDRRLYIWNITGDGFLHAVKGVKLKTRPAQCTDFISIKKHLGMLTRMKVTNYRFALNWSLILPNGDFSNINREVLRYYRCMVEEASNLGIKSMVTLYYPTHGSISLPLPLVQKGGWLNGTITQTFYNYAQLCFQELGDLVKEWITINEPNRLSLLYYNKSSSITYQAAHNMLLAHAMAWQLYDKKYRPIQNGMVSLALHTAWFEPANPFVKAHIEAVHRSLQFDLAWLAEPIFGSGDYPVYMKEYINLKNQKGLSNSSLPQFTEEEMNLVKGSADFFALNHFTTKLVAHNTKNGSRYDLDRDCHFQTDPTWLKSANGLAIVPSGIRKILNWVKQQYGNIPIYITSNGIDDKSSNNDKIRMYYIQQYSQQILLAYLKDKINVKGYYALALTDRTDRTKPQYGFFNSPLFNFKAKSSVDMYSVMVSNNGFPLEQSTNICSIKSEEKECSLCTFLIQKKSLIFFGFCLLATLIILLTVTIIRKYKRKRRKLRSEKHKQTVCFLFQKKDGFSQC